MPRARRKAELPQKTCAACGRPFVWRKKWQKVWAEVRYCSEPCRGAEGVRRVGAALWSRHAVLPRRLPVGDPAPRGSERHRICATDPDATLLGRAHESCLLETREVGEQGRHRDVERQGEVRDGRRSLHQAHEDGTSRLIGKRMEHGVEAVCHAGMLEPND